ncbi:MAG: copper amine oxidase family proteinLeucine Rich Repeat (LRR)-containing [Paenibacillaceae bacterium]|nr:copper amine oxidase family proteinLeucine Rich Repeat (LRR)-containing [Paenibacillaceae bacterium]
MMQFISGMKRSLSRLLLVCLACALLPGGLNAQAAGSTASEAAAKLAEIGIFQGTDAGLELDRQPSRLEGLVMLIRLLGKEADAAGLADGETTFRDVPQWGQGYVNYAGQHQLANGITEERFGADESISALQFVTLLLRALGYNDAAGDFRYEEALEEAQVIGFVDRDTIQRLERESFTRGSVAELSFAALTIKVKDGSSTLANKLIAEGAFTRAQAQRIGVSTAAAAAPDSGKDKIVTFADPGLEAVIRKALDKPEGNITAGDTQSIHKLKDDTYAKPTGRIQSLEGIQALSNLEELSLPYHLIQDLRPLSGMQSLRSLNFARNKIEDITPLAGLTDLESLDIVRNFLYDIKPVAGMKELQYLSVKGNAITDLSPIQGLDRLETLYVGSNAVTDIEIIRSMPKLVYVDVDNNPIADISPLADKDYQGFDKLEHITALGQKAKEIISAIIRPGMSNLEKEEAVHDYILQNVQYDYDYTGTSNGSAYGALIEGLALCGGYADAMLTLGRMAGLDIIIIDGHSGEDLHAWNLIRLDGKYYHVDATWDDGGYVLGQTSLSDQEMKKHYQSRVYFNNNHAERMAQDIYWDVSRYPEVDSEFKPGVRQISVSTNAEAPMNSNLLVWHSLVLRYTKDNATREYTATSAQLASPGATRLEGTFLIPPEVPLDAGNVEYTLTYHLFDTALIVTPVQEGLIFTNSINSQSYDFSGTLRPDSHLYVTLFKEGSKGGSFNQAEFGGKLESYALSASSFSRTSKPRKGTIPPSNLVQVVNNTEVTLPAYSAIYTAEVFQGADFDDKSGLYLYGEQAIAVNHSDVPKVFKPGEIVYTLRPAAGIPCYMYLRLSVFDGDFDEGKYEELVDTKLVLFTDKWIKIE